jgi:transcription elongation factor B subunit 1
MSEESEYVTLISSDGYSFIVQRSSACISGAIKRMLDPSCTLEQYHTRSHMPSWQTLPDGFAESKSNTCRFENIKWAHTTHLTLGVAARLTCSVCSGLVLEKVCEYFYYNEKHKNSKDVPDIDVPAELCLELLMAADYLNGTWNVRGEETHGSQQLLTFYDQ